VLSRKVRSFNELQNDLQISPSTLSRILKYLRAKGSIEVKIVHDDILGIRKVYSLTKKGKKVLPLFKKLDNAKAEVLDLVG